MNELAKKGKFTTIRIFASVLLISIYVIVSYNILLDNVETSKIIQQIIRFCLTVLLMYFIFKGKRWAVMVFTALFSIAAVGAFFSLFKDIPFWGKTPFAVMVLIYTAAIVHLNFSKSFKEYFSYLSEEQ